MEIPKWKGLAKKSLLFISLVLSLLLLDSTSFLFTSHLHRNNRPTFTDGQISSTLEPRSRSVSSKWIVVTSGKTVTEQIKRLGKNHGWTLLVVVNEKGADTSEKSLANGFHPNIVILTPKDQMNLNYSIIKLLPRNITHTYSRKLIGYLYAIEHGADFIYDTDDDSDLPDNLEKYFDLKETTRGLILNNAKKLRVIFNPYAHFGQPTVWPRGYSSAYQYGDKMVNNTYTACQMSTPLVQQGLANGDPDVDSTPPLILPKKVLAPFNAQNTIFHHKAFWAMLLPVSVDSRVADVWRGYWAQPLLWAIGGHLRFYSVPGNRPSQNLTEEAELYVDAGNLIQFLKEWKCSNEDLYKCMIELTSAMAERKFWSRTEVQLVKAWISDLKSIGYKPPEFNSRKSPCLDGKPKSFALFTGVQIKQKTNHRNALRKFCRFPKPRISSNKTLQPIQFASTLLVVTFNYPHYENIWLLDLIYRPHYPNILYCGNFYNLSIHSKLLRSSTFLAAGINGFSFVRANVTKGIFAYECALRAIDMNYGVTGYLVLSDDVLFNFWNNRDLNMNEIWSPMSTFSKSYPFNKTTKLWKWWKSKYGVRVTKLALTKIYQDSSNIHVQKFRKQREKFGYNVTSIGRGISDIFYIPKGKQEMFHEVGSILRKQGVFLEIAIPILMTGLSSPENAVELHGKFIWDYDRMHPFDFFNASANFIHPVKPGFVIDDEFQRAEYCRKYVRRVLKFGEAK